MGTQIGGDQMTENTINQKRNEKDKVQVGPTWGLRLIASLPMQGLSQSLLNEDELRAVKSHSEKAASAYEVVLGNYCVQKTRADSADKEIERLREKTNRLIRGYQSFDFRVNTEDLNKEDQQENEGDDE
jgi:hypothetical protein